jgi:hypothetical protein
MATAKNTQIKRTIPLLVAICLLSFPAYAKYGGGTGEPNDPYQIATAEDLMLLGDSPGDYDKHFILTADIDLDPNLPGRKVFDKAVIAPDANDVTKHYFEGTPFTGVFDGNSHMISHLTVEGISFLGLFGQLGSGARIANVGLEAVKVSGTTDCVGGLVGHNDGSIAASYSTGAVSGGQCVGGLVGWSVDGSIATSYSTGAVSGGQYVGGLVGWNVDGSIIASNSSSKAAGDRSVGGLVGWNTGSIAMSYSAGTVSGGHIVGGLVGRNWGNITTSYSTGTVTGSTHVGGLVGDNISSITSSFWDMKTSGQTTSDGGTGLTTTEMQDINTYLNAGWDFVDEMLNGTCNYWQISPSDYPRLRYHAGESPVMPKGLGTVQEPYLIRDARDLGSVWFKPLAHYRLEASVDLSGITWSMAVVPWFEGTFDGSGHTVSHLTIKGGSYLGLYGKLHHGANVSNLGLEAVDINGIGNFIGGLTGSNAGRITTNYTTGTVTGDGPVGGLVGFNAGEDNGNVGSIAMSYSTATVSGGQYVGGLVGDNLSSITSSYSTGTVTGDRPVGGLVGFNSGGDRGHASIITSYSIGMVTGSEGVAGLVGWNTGSITTSYSTGTVAGNSDVGGLVGLYVGDVTTSFWDMHTSGQTTSAGGTGMTTAEMQTAGTFLDAGWDFVGETANGTEDIWWILEGKDYPRLWWEAAKE